VKFIELHPPIPDGFSSKKSIVGFYSLEYMYLPFQINEKEAKMS